MRYCNPELDRWIVEAERVNGRPEKIALFSKIQTGRLKRICRRFICWYPANVLVARKRVGNIQIEPSGSWFFIQN